MKDTALLPLWLSRSLRPVLLVAYVLPLVWLIATSLKSAQDLNSDPAGLIFRPTLDNYVTVLSPDLVRAASLTLAIAVGTTFIVLILGVPGAFVVSRLKGHTRIVVVSALLLFQLVPPAATLIPQYRLLFQTGLLGTIQGLVVVDAAGILPFAILVLTPFCTALPGEVLDASAVDGVGPIRFISQILFPLIRNGILVVGVLTFILAWGEFLAAITFINDPALQPLSVMVISFLSNNSVNYGVLTALAILGSIPLLLLYLAVQRQMREGLAIGAVR